jgi:hypothetical protein
MIVETIGQFRKLSQTELAETICEHLKWRTASGSNKVDAGRKLLRKLEKMGYVCLPKKRPAPNKVDNDVTKCVSITSRTDPGSEIAGKVGDFSDIAIEVADCQQSRELWNEYVCRYHYLGYKKPFGFHLRYFIKADRRIWGCVLFSGAAKAIGIRDRWIGWEPKRRLKNLAWVVNNSRFLILPWVRVKYLASHVLSAIERRICEDWEDKWGYRPVLMETFVDPRRYKGTCYRAANWRYLGETTGAGLVRKGKSYRTSPKMIFVRPLGKNFRESLCSNALRGRVLP